MLPNKAGRLVCNTLYFLLLARYVPNVENEE